MNARPAPRAQALRAAAAAVVGLLCALAAPGCNPGKPVPAPPPAPNLRPAAEPNSLTLLTWNVDAHGPKPKERNAAILALLREAKADIMAFQEADADFVNALGEEDWIKGAYRLTKLKGEGTAVRGVILCSRLPVEKWEYRVLPGSQARAAVLIHTVVHGQEFFVASAHLESPLDDAPVRLEQLKLLLGRLGEPEGAVLMGDLNFGDGAQPETGALGTDYADPWPALHAGQPGYTWDLERNPRAKEGAFAGETSRRLDRILVRSPRLKASSIRLIGDAPMPHADGLFPSDHFGVVATFVWE